MKRYAAWAAAFAVADHPQERPRPPSPRELRRSPPQATTTINDDDHDRWQHRRDDDHDDDARLELELVDGHDVDRYNGVNGHDRDGHHHDDRRRRRRDRGRGAPHLLPSRPQQSRTSPARTTVTCVGRLDHPDRDPGRGLLG